MLGTDIAIDLGTSTVKIYLDGKGVILKEPAVVAYNVETEEVVAIGSEAYAMVGRTSDRIDVVQPLCNGVISDFDLAQYLISHYMKQISGSKVFMPRVVVSVPCLITEVEKRAVVNAISSAGVRKICLIEEPVAAAMGAGVKIDEPHGTLIVDIGGGTTDIAVISLSGIVESTSIKIAGDQFDEAIVKYIRRKHNVLIGERTAEELKMQIGCVFPRPEEQTVEIKGRCLMTGLPRVFSVSSSEMIEAFEEVSTRILEAIHGVLERTPPELVADISTNGICMTGGGSLVWGFDKLIESHTGIETHVADDAISCVAYGTGKSLDDVDSMQDGTINLSRRKQMN